MDKAYVEAVAILNNILTKIDQYNSLNTLISGKVEHKTIIPIPVIFPVFIKYNFTNKRLNDKKNNGHNKGKWFNLYKSDSYCLSRQTWFYRPKATIPGYIDRFVGSIDFKTIWKYNFILK